MSADESTEPREPSRRRQHLPAIAVDLRQASHRPTGVGRYLLDVANAAVYAGVRVRAFVREAIEQGLDVEIPQKRFAATGLRWHYEAWRELRRSHEIFVSTSFIVPQAPGIRALPAVLDITTRLYPEYHTRRTRIAERLLLPRAVARWPILTCSEATARDLRRHFPSLRVTVVVPPVVRVAPRAVGSSDVRAAQYALFVGTLEPRKNLSTALKAVEVVRRAGRDLRLVVVGKVGWHADLIRAQLDRAVTEGWADWLGYVTDAERDRLYHEAAVVLVPSVYEGFGLPLLEAMAHGAPCVASSTPALTEVSGGAAIHADPLDVPQWVAAITAIVTDSQLASQLRTRGVARAAEFSLARASAAVSRALHEAMR